LIFPRIFSSQFVISPPRKIQSFIKC